MKTKSFTLIELLVVIVIIGILSGVIIVSVSSSINKANFAKAQAFSNTVQNELLGDLVSEWTFNSPAVSGKTEDTWGNNDGTVYGGATYKTKADGVCVYGGCYFFDGTNDYIDCGNGSSLGIADKITISAWVKPSVLGNRAILSKWGTGSQFLFSLYENKLTLESPDNVFYYSNSAPIVNEWNFVNITLDGTNIKHYINGKFDRVQAQQHTLQFAQTSNFLIGSLVGASWWFNGLIDDIRVYSKALSSAQIKQQYVAGLDSLLSKNLISQEEYNQKLNSLAHGN